GPSNGRGRSRSHRLRGPRRGLRWARALFVAAAAGAARAPGHPSGPGSRGRGPVQRRHGRAGEGAATSSRAQDRLAAASSLGELGPLAGTAGAQALICALQRDRHPAVRRAAASALGGLGPALCWQCDFGEGAGLLAVEAARGATEHARLRAASALASVGAAAAEAGALVRACSEQDDVVAVRRAESTDDQRLSCLLAWQAATARDDELLVGLLSDAPGINA
ncbi:unnamed protein product, partial [Prorocentrum cordatum]